MDQLSVAYAYVEPDGSPPQCQIRQVPQEIEGFLLEHVKYLLTRVTNGSAAPASFLNLGARQRFENLLSTDDAEFLANAQELAERLQDRMDQRTKPGFFVALQRSGGIGDPQAAVLKLDVTHEIAAAVRQDDAGEFLLEAIRNLLDLPGDLHKGAVYPDSRRDSDVVVGDKVMVDTALYFLKTIEARQVVKPAAAARVLFKSVQRHAPSKVGAVAKVLNEKREKISPKDFFKAHPDLLEDKEREQILEELDKKEERRVLTLQPRAKPIRKIVKADGLEIRGEVGVMEDRVDWEATPDGWKITIDVEQEPRARYE